MRLDQVIAQAAKRLADKGIDTARLDARLLAAHALGLSDADIILQFDRSVTQAEADRFDAFILRRMDREPIAHILGQRDFWGLPFKVSKDTLVPRPDSETLVEGVLERIKDRSRALRIVDIGTGSGCLLIALLSELPNASGLGVDVSDAALEIAAQNAKSLGVSDRCAFAKGNYAFGLEEDFDILISNPPYLAEAEKADLDEDVARFDPHGALISGPSGLEAYDAMFHQIVLWEQIPQLMAFEFGYKQAEAVKALARDAGLIAPKITKSVILNDLGGRNRAILFEK